MNSAEQGMRDHTSNPTSSPGQEAASWGSWHTGSLQAAGKSGGGSEHLSGRSMEGTCCFQVTQQPAADTTCAVRYCSLWHGSTISDMAPAGDLWMA